MGIYDLNNINYLQHDIENILIKIEEFYRVDFLKEQTIFHPKTFLSNGHHWTSELSTEIFNKLIPPVKSLHKDMYAVIEVIFTSKIGWYDKTSFENKYPYLKEFRLLNNKFKHYKDKEAEINFTELVFIEPHGNLIDVYCTFKYREKFEALRFCDFIEIFLQILEDEKIIIIDRK